FGHLAGEKGEPKGRAPAFSRRVCVFRLQCVCATKSLFHLFFAIGRTTTCRCASRNNGYPPGHYRHFVSVYFLQFQILTAMKNTPTWTSPRNKCGTDRTKLGVME